MSADMHKKKSIPFWPVAFWLAIWQLASEILRREHALVLLASPAQTLHRLFSLMLTGEFWYALTYSMQRILGGFFLAGAAAILLSALSVRHRWVGALLAPMALAVKTIPIASFIILALILFSSRHLSMLISFLMVFPILYTNIRSGILSADRQLLEMGKVFRLSAGRSIRYLYLPQVMPYLRSGCSISAGLCWKAGISAEIIGIPEGSIGEHLFQAKIYLDTPDLFAWTLALVLASLLFEKVLMYLLDKGAKSLERL